MHVAANSSMIGIADVAAEQLAYNNGIYMYQPTATYE